MSVIRRPLAGYVVNISISESDDSARFGFPSWQVNRVILQTVAALFGQGATILFGHDWREDGVMEAVYGFARQMQPPVPLSTAHQEPGDEPLLLNLLPWPDQPYLSSPDLQRLSSTLRVQSAGLPEQLRAAGDRALNAGRDSPLYQYLRARGLTFLRHRLNDNCHVRLCLGGRRAGSAGRYPGVIEEALFALRSKKPLYLAGLLGGVTQQIIDAVEGKVMPDEFCSATRVRPLYENPPIQEFDKATLDDRAIDREAVWKEFGKAGRNGLADAARLTAEEIKELFHTRVLDRVIELVLVSLSRLSPELPER